MYSVMFSFLFKNQVLDFVVLTWGNTFWLNKEFRWSNWVGCEVESVFSAAAALHYGAYFSPIQQESMLMHHSASPTKTQLSNMAGVLVPELIRIAKAFVSHFPQNIDWNLINIWDFWSLSKSLSSFHQWMACREGHIKMNLNFKL